MDTAPTPNAAAPEPKKRKAGAIPIPILSPAQLLRWIIWSIFAHVLLAAFLTQKDTVLQLVGIQPPTEAEVAASQQNEAPVERIAQIVEDVREHQADQIREKVAELIEAQQMLAQADEKMVGEYREFAKEMAEGAGDKVGEAQEAAVNAQKEALAAQEKAEAAQKEMLSTAQELSRGGLGGGERQALAGKLAEQKKDAQKAQDAVEEAQKKVDNAQVEAGKALNFADSNYTEAAKSQADSRASQSEAGTAQQIAVVAQDDMADFAKRVEQAEQKVEQQQKKVEEAQGKVAAAEQKVVEQQAAVTTAQTALTEKQGALETANAALAAGGDKKEVKTAEGEVKKAQGVVNEANKKVANAQKQVDQLQQQVKKQEEALAKVQQEAEAAPKGAADHVKGIIDKQELATKEQREALAAQNNTLDAVKQAQAKSGPGGGQQAAASSPAVEQAVMQAKPMEAPKNLDGKSLAELLDLATKAEDSSTELYREMRAAETATQRQMTLDEARKITDVARPERKALDSELLTKEITTAEEARAHTAAVREAIREIDSMLTLAKEIKQEVEGSPASLEQVKATAQQTAALEAEAAQDYNQRAKDLTDLMRAASTPLPVPNPDGPMGPHGAHPPQSAFYKPVAEAKAEDDSLIASSAMMASVAVDPATQLGAMMATLTQEGRNQAFAQAAAAAEALDHSGNGGMGGGAFTADTQGPGLAPGMAGFPELRAGDNRINASSGRKIMKGQNAKEPWMFVDTWYIIGPFPNPSRQNIDKQFPPESVVDLDATYRGKGDRMIKWQFVQTGEPMIRPPQPEEYQIYYAYTELWFEEASDRWIAVGSDDYSKLWVEGMLVWKSGDQLKGWNVKEGYRKVHFKKGLNRILYRVENGWRSTNFSLCVNLQEGKQSPAELAN
jgi:hypothetical protein